MKTREKLKKSQVTSNVESEDSEGKPRKRLKKPRIFDDSSDEDRPTLLPRPPPVKRNFSKCQMIEDGKFVPRYFACFQIFLLGLVQWVSANNPVDHQLMW